MQQYDAVYQCGLIVQRDEKDSVAGGSGDFVLDPETGVLTCYDQTEDEKDLVNREVVIRAYAVPAYVKDGEFALDPENTVRTEISLSLSAVLPETKAYESTVPLEFPSVGVRIDRLLIEVKPQEIYATIECTVTDEAAFARQEDGVWFEFIDPNSTETEEWKQQLSSGLTGTGSVSLVVDGKFQQHETLGLKELHDAYTLRAYNCWNKERYESQEFIMKPVE